MIATHVLVPTEEWSQTMNRLDKQEQQIKTILNYIGAGNSETMTRQQAMAFLHIGSTKLWELAQAGEIKTTSVGSKMLYVSESCRAYLAGRGYSKEAIETQVLSMLNGKSEQRRGVKIKNAR